VRQRSSVAVVYNEAWPHRQSKPRWVSAVPAAGLVTAILLVSGGCSLVLPFEAPPKPAIASDVVVTGSITPRPTTSPREPYQVISTELDPEDWRRAEGALAVALDPQGNGGPAAWDNAESRRRGSFAPVGEPVLQNDLICRGFLARIISVERTSEHRGRACRTGPGQWEVRDVTPG